ncbi:GNAT family N-acetyltransferase [Parabacteroides faecis]|uniref:GNAT family N-acetyltransferase n=1 Tax=Parabacteroides faecis TaxID=1217282 RepID=UPI002164D2D2|nr:GNAT family protein [Parabacteroides faecis]MCS2893631.1 GNAT family N-acetyltransferase [Parabacteroides faecis]UVQ47776.1 GNAT family N-acetyltransferase [Parabacteroides faecis]
MKLFKEWIELHIGFEQSGNKNKIMMTEFPIIKTNRLLLRQFIRSDVENVYKGLSHSDVIKYYGISFDSLEATEEQMNWFADLVRNKTGIWWAICSSDNTTFYGAGGLNGLSKEHKKAEIGFWLLPDFWGQGIMQEAFPLICNFGFKKLNLHRIEGFVDTENLNCIKSLKMLDFTHEGTMKECEIKNGKYISIDIYAKLNEK